MIKLCRSLIKKAIEATTAWVSSLETRFEAPSTRPYGLAIVEGTGPAVLKSRTLYVLTEDQMPWYATMICPCGCGAKIELNLLTDERPCWQFSVDKKGRPSLHPSVWRHVDCCSHFILRQGQIIWAMDGVSIDRPSPSKKVAPRRR